MRPTTPGPFEHLVQSASSPFPVALAVFAHGAANELGHGDPFRPGLAVKPRLVVVGEAD